MSALDFGDLSRHLGHALECVAYVGADGEPVNIAVECEDCGEVLLDFEKSSAGSVPLPQAVTMDRECRPGAPPD
jgi:hypothetical protein